MKYTAAQLVFTKLGTALGKDLAREFAAFIKERETHVLGDMVAWRTRRDIISQWRLNNFASRQDDDASNIFNRRNETMGIVRSAIRFIAARTKDDIFGTAPYFAVSPEPSKDAQGAVNADLATRIYGHASGKVRLSGFEQVAESAITEIFNLGEQILWGGWRKQVNRYFVLSRVLVGPDGAPVIASNGDYVYEEDGLTQAQPNDENEPPAAAEETEAPMVVAKDPTIALTPDRKFIDWLEEKSDTVYDGLQTVPVDYRNWRCSTAFAKIEDSPFRGHFYDCRLSELLAKLQDYHGGEYDEATQAMIERLKNNTPAPKDETKTTGNNASGGGGDDKNPVIRCFNFEADWDPEGQGNTSTFFGTLLYDQDELFFFDYLCNVTPEGQSLYTSNSIYNPPNTWHGTGLWEMFEEVTMNADRLWNSLLYRDGMIANPLTGVDWSCIEEQREEVDFGPGARVTLKTNKTMAQFMQAFVMPDSDKGSWELLQYMLKLNEQEAGSSGAAKGDVGGGLAATNTATGIQSILSSGSVLHKEPAKQIRDGLECFLSKSIALLYSMQNKEESFRVGEGEQSQMATLTPQEIAGMKMNVQVLLTRMHLREMLQNAQVAAGAYTQYISLPEQEKDYGRPLYLQILMGLGIQNGEGILRKGLPPQPQPNIPSERIQANVKDLPPTSAMDALNQMGIKTVPEEFVAKAEAEQKKNNAPKKEIK